MTLEELFVNEYEKQKEEIKTLKVSYEILEQQAECLNELLEIAKNIFEQSKVEILSSGSLWINSVIVNGKDKEEALRLLKHLRVEVKGLKNE